MCYNNLTRQSGFVFFQSSAEMSLVVEFVSLVDIPSAAHLIESKHKSSKTEAFVQSYVVLFDRTVESLRRL